MTMHQAVPILRDDVSVGSDTRLCIGLSRYHVKIHWAAPTQHDEATELPRYSATHHTSSVTVSAAAGDALPHQQLTTVHNDRQSHYLPYRWSVLVRYNYWYRTQCGVMVTLLASHPVWCNGNAIGIAPSVV